MAYGQTPWNKAEALLAALRRSRAQLVVIGDADVWCEGLPAAVEAVERGARWAVPHRGVFRLSEAGTQQLFDGATDWERLELAQPPYRGTVGGGYVIAPRHTLLDIPLDPRFVGWGQEDESWGLALTALAGPPWRGRAPLVHLFHPPQDRMSRRWGSLESRRLAQRYAEAHRRGEMAQIIQEAQDFARATHQPAMHAQASQGDGNR